MSPIRISSKEIQWIMIHDGLGPRYSTVSPICVASIVDSPCYGTELKCKVLPSFPAKGGGYVPERDKPTEDTMDVLDLVIEY
jgi:hypothetical protein